MERALRDFADDGRYHGPNLAIVAVVYTVLSLGSSLITIVASRGTLPPPFGTGLEPRFFFPGYLGLVRVASFLQFGAAIPLGIFAATAVGRLRFLKVNVAGVFIAFFGGMGAALFMALSGLFQWTLSEPEVSTLPYARVLVHYLSFAVGGIGFIAAFGLLVAGISVIAWFTGLLPQWLAAFGLILAALAEIASLTLLFNVLAILLPVVHVLGFIWIIATGMGLPSRGPQVRQATFAAAA